MAKPKYDMPTNCFPYMIKKRLNKLCKPRKYIYISNEELPLMTPWGVRVSAIRGRMTELMRDAAWPYSRRLILTKKQYKNKFSPERLERIDRMIEASNATRYAKLASCMKDRKKSVVEKKRKAWSESEWKKHMDYIGQIAAPKKCPQPTPIVRGPAKPLDELMPRLIEISRLPNYKMYKRESKQSWFRDNKVSPKAMKYVISDRIKKLAVPRVTLSPD